MNTIVALKVRYITYNFSCLCNLTTKEIILIIKQRKNEELPVLILDILSSVCAALLKGLTLKHGCAKALHNLIIAILVQTSFSFAHGTLAHKAFCRLLGFEQCSCYCTRAFSTMVFLVLVACLLLNPVQGGCKYTHSYTTFLLQFSSSILFRLEN